MKHYSNVTDFRQLFRLMRNELYNTPAVNVGEWQSQHGESIMMREMLHVSFEYPMPGRADDAATLTGARVPWAEDHFLERTSGMPMNPAPSEAWWPFRKKTGNETNAEHKSEGEAFSHTYPERMWPKTANGGRMGHSEFEADQEHLGIRFAYGDLQDVVNQLARTPMTRQAYLPIWFPEDTGAVHGKRVPCTLGYHFIIRDGKLDITYFMRSTDLLRHFQDDVYMAIRLAQWAVANIQDVWDHRDSGSPIAELKVGKLIFHTANMHIFEGDNAMIDFWKSQDDRLWF